MLTLAIETSCDETGVSVTDGRHVLSNMVSSSVRLHKIYGGVVPEIASRFHIEYMIDVLSKALANAGKTLGDMRLVAVTNGPGLVGALLTGIALAKSISYARGLPLINVNHILAHLYSSFLSEGRRPNFPFVGLVVSGGHTALFLCKDFDRQKLLGQTQDDAAGEAYDKVAKLLGLGYPGGPIIERTARRAKGADSITFPKVRLGKDSLDFSFSGIKTAVLYYVQSQGSRVKKMTADVCWAFQEAVLDVLVEKALLACEMNKIKQVVVGGGVAANSLLREKFSRAAKFTGAKVYFPEMRYCMDNAAMIGFLGEKLYRKGYRSSIYMSAEPNLLRKST